MKKTQRRILASMIVLADDSMHVKCSVSELARHAGYKAAGGAISTAIEFLEINNKIVKTGESAWMVTL